MENKIKITVEYEKPEMNKIDALMEQYAMAEQIADATEMEIKPLIKECGMAKYTAICEQLTSIGQKLRKFCLIGKRIYHPYLCADYRLNGEHRRFKIVYNYENDNLSYLYHLGNWCDGYNFMYESNLKHLFECDGLVTHWNSFNIIEDFNKELEKLIESHIKGQFERVEKVQKHFNEMSK